MAEMKPFFIVPKSSKDTVGFNTYPLTMCKDCSRSLMPEHAGCDRYCMLLGRHVSNDWFCAHGIDEDDKERKPYVSGHPPKVEYETRPSMEERKAKAMIREELNDAIRFTEEIINTNVVFISLDMAKRLKDVISK